jgi:hypothetical protein
VIKLAGSSCFFIESSLPFRVARGRTTDKSIHQLRVNRQIPSFGITMRGLQPATTLATSILAVPTRSSGPLSVPIFRVQQQGQWFRSAFAGGRAAGNDLEMHARSGNSTVNGVVIGLLSSFGSALLIALILIVVYFFRYTAGGRILLDRIGRPGEYDDEQAFLREEAEALEEMDDLQRTEYLRAKGRLLRGFWGC